MNVTPFEAKHKQMPHVFKIFLDALNMGISFHKIEKSSMKKVRNIFLLDIAMNQWQGISVFQYKHEQTIGF